MRTRREFLRDGAAAAAVAGFPAIVTPAHAADQVTLVLPLGFNIDFFDSMNAHSGGHFARQGLEVKIIGANSGVQTIQLVATGEATFGRDAPVDIVRAIVAKQKAPIVFASIFQGCPFRVFSLAAKPVHAPADFKGKTVGLITLASPTGIYLDVMLAHAGLKPDDVVRQATGGTPGAIEILKQGRVDCFISTIGVETALQRAGEKVEVLNPYQYLPLAGQSYCAMPDTLAAKGDITVRFLNACKASIDEMIEGPLPPLIARASKDFEIPGVNDMDMSVAILGATVKGLLLAEGRDKILVNLPDRWAAGVKALADAHIVDIPDAGVLYTNRYVDAALKG